MFEDREKEESIQLEISKHLVTDPDAKLNLEDFMCKYEKDCKHWNSMRQGMIDCKDRDK